MNSSDNLNCKHEVGDEFSPLYSPDDVALLLNCSTRHVRRLVYEGNFPKPIKVGRLSRWTQPTIKQWFAQKIDLPKGMSK